ncbi:MAG: pyridoxal 5'-phosphate synthase glutaminase subunit PdxT [Acidimicrobiales bacterium]
MNPVIGVLALQGAFAAHMEVLGSIGVRSAEVRTTADLARVDALVLPGGESSTMWMLLESTGLADAVEQRVTGGMAVFGTCAGMILLAARILDGREDQSSFAAIDIDVRRNAYGRQVDSFEADLHTAVGDVRGVFIRAPRIERVGEGVEVLARHGDEPVLVRSGSALAASFHPELSGDGALHRYFVSTVREPGRV